MLNKPLNGSGPWPLCPTSPEAPVPMGVLADVALAGPGPQPEVLLDTLLWDGVHGVCLSTADRTPLGWYWSHDEPPLDTPLPLECAVGWSGSVVFGRGAPGTRLLGLGLELDPRCVAVVPPPAGDILVVDGVEYPMPSRLVIATSGYIVARRSGQGVELARADALLDDEARWRLFQDFPDDAMEATAIAGVGPDANGNVELSITPQAAGLVSVVEWDGAPIGLVISASGGFQGFTECASEDLRERLRCRTEVGTNYPLPLDKLIPLCPECPEDDEENP